MSLEWRRPCGADTYAPRRRPVATMALTNTPVTIWLTTIWLTTLDSFAYRSWWRIEVATGARLN